MLAIFLCARRKLKRLAHAPGSLFQQGLRSLSIHMCQRHHNRSFGYAPGLFQQGRSLGQIKAGGLCHNRGGPRAQLLVAGDDIDHQVAIGFPQANSWLRC